MFKFIDGLLAKMMGRKLKERRIAAAAQAAADGKKVSVRLLATEMCVPHPKTSRAKDEVVRILYGLGFRVERQSNPAHIRVLPM